MTSIDLAPCMEAVARAVLGEPNPTLSSKTELRFGTHGSLSVDVVKGTFYDHQEKAGGGVLDFLRVRKGLANGAAFDFLRQLGFDIGESSHSIAPRGKAAQAKSSGGLGKLVASFDYLDELGKPVLQVRRFEPKTFRQFRPDPARPGKWLAGVKDVRVVPYRLPELVEAIGSERVVFVPEGEKHVDRLATLGIPATCNPMGAGKWPEHFQEWFADADVVILPDNDAPGAKHARQVAENLAPVAARVRILDLPDLPPKGDVIDWLDASNPADRLYALAESVPDFDPSVAPPEPSRYGAIWFEEIGRRKAVREWLVKRVLAAGEFSVLFGDPGCGKSFLAIDMSLRLASAAMSSLVLQPGWFGLATRPMGVAYLAPEGGRGLELRIQAWRDHNRVPAGQPLPFVLLPVSIDLRAPDGDTNNLIAEIKTLSQRMSVPLGLIVVDTLARALAGGNENASEDMGALIRNCERLQRELNAHVLAVHHKGKDDTKGPRGWSGLRAAVDTMIEVERLPEGGNRWTIRKQKDGEEGVTRDFALNVVDVGVDTDGDAVTSCVVVAAEPGDVPRGIKKGSPKNLTVRAKIGLQVLRKGLVSHGEPAPYTLGLPRGVSVLRYETWRDAVAKQLFEPGEDPSPDAVRQAIKRVGEELVAKSVIGRDDPYLWIVREPSS